MKLNWKYRSYIKWLMFLVIVVPVVLAFFTLPLMISVPFAIFCALASWLAPKLIFRYPQIFIHSGIPLVDELNKRIAFIWCKAPFNGQLRSELGILYETREAAKTAYQILRSWNFGAFIDSESNIVVSFVYEGSSKYSIVLYPGERQKVKDYIRSSTLAELEPSSEVDIVAEMKPYMVNCADYTDRPEMLEFIESLKGNDVLLLNTFYLKDNEPIAYAKRGLQLKHINFLKRENLSSGTLEFHLRWKDPNKECPDTVERVREIKISA